MRSIFHQQVQIKTHISADICELKFTGSSKVRPLCEESMKKKVHEPVPKDNRMELLPNLISSKRNQD